MRLSSYPMYDDQLEKYYCQLNSLTMLPIVIQLRQNLKIIKYLTSAMTHKRIQGYTICLQELLGKGSYGSVYKGEQDGTKKKCAIKILEKSKIDTDEYLKKALFQEITILQSVTSPNIVGVYEVMESNSNYYIVQEYCDGGDLEHLIKKKKVISEVETIQIIKEICNGFLTLVKEGIVHRDLKPANILISGGVAKIADFGFAKKTKKTKRMEESTVGTPLYMSLQVLLSQPYTSKCDIWAIGLITYELCHGMTPWIGRSEAELARNTEKMPLKFNPKISAVTQDFIRKCLGIEEKARANWEEVFLHPIFEQYFHEYAAKNHLLVNQFKMVMRELRIKINAQNLDLNRLLQKLNLHKSKELGYEDFNKFIKHINPNITQEEVDFFFMKMDTNEDGSIDMMELSNAMEEHRISFNKNLSESQLEQLAAIHNYRKIESLGVSLQEQRIPQKEGDRLIDHKQEQLKLTKDLQIRVKKSFIRLYKILQMKNISIYKTFVAYDRDKSGELGLEEFKAFIRRLDSSFTDDQVKKIFDFIDTDGSKTIEFDEFNSYYCQVNGIPQSLDLPPDYYSNKLRMGL